MNYSLVKHSHKHSDKHNILIMIKVPKQSFPCPHCAKIYRRKREWDLHKATCGIIQNSSDVISEKEVEIRQDNNMMSHEQMCDVIKMLVIEQTKLKTQVKTLQQQLSTIRRKVTVEEYLSQSIKPSQDINVFMKKLAVNTDEFKELIENKLDNALENVIIRVMNTCDINEIPMRTFTGHTGTVYCYENEIWRKMNDNDWNKICGIVKQSIMNELKTMTDMYENRLSEDAFSLRYNTYVQKIMSCMSRVQPKLMSLICQRVRVSLNSVTTFEFTFN